jgi:hypothetical protein
MRVPDYSNGLRTNAIVEMVPIQQATTRTIGIIVDWVRSVSSGESIMLGCIADPRGQVMQAE